MEIKVISFEEFRKLVEVEVLKSFESFNTQELCSHLLDTGFMKLTQDNIPQFLKENFIFIKGNLIVDFGDAQFMWMVSGINAMVIDKSIERK